MSEMLENPFSETPIEEVPLDDDSLVKVLAQVRFPPIASIEERRGVAGFQRQLASEYPVMREDAEITAVISGDGQIAQAGRSTVRRFSNRNDSWVVSLAPTWVALETTEYTSRTDFIERWTHVLEALALLDPVPAVYDRLGVRYVDRLVGPDATTDLHLLVRKDAVGTLALSDGMGESGEVVGTLTQTHFRLDGLQMMARWGRIPPSATVLPGIDPVDEISWFLDMDVYVEAAGMDFDIGDIVDASNHSAEHAYRFFRWVMTEEFIRRRGGRQ